MTGKVGPVKQDSASVGGVRAGRRWKGGRESERVPLQLSLCITGYSAAATNQTEPSCCWHCAMTLITGTTNTVKTILMCNYEHSIISAIT